MPREYVIGGFLLVVGLAALAGGLYIVSGRVTMFRSATTGEAAPAVVNRRAGAWMIPMGLGWVFFAARHLYRGTGQTEPWWLVWAGGAMMVVALVFQVQFIRFLRAVRSGRVRL